MSDKIELTQSQKSVVRNAVSNQYAAIKGSAGSGKTFVAMNIAKELSSKSNLELEDLIHNCEQVCIVTYTKSLASFLKTNSSIDSSSIYIVFDFFEEFLKLHNITLKFDDLKRDFIQEKVQHINLSMYEISDEISYIFFNCCETIDDYVSKRSDKYDLETLSTLHKAALDYRTYMKIRQYIDYDDVSNKVLETIGKFSCNPMSINLIVDEVQDLSYSAIKALTALTKRNVYYIGDMTQSLYATQFEWKSVLPEGTRMYDLDSNLRNSRQVFDAANSILRYETYLNEKSAKNYSRDTVETFKEGNRPQVFFCQDVDIEIIQLKYKIDEIRKGNPNSSICIAYRKKSKNTENIQMQLAEYGYEVEQIKETLHETPNIIILSSLHSMKGLEFDHVILVEMNENSFFMHKNTDESLERRLMYVAMTRARESLSLFTSDNRPVRFIAEISAEKIVPIALNIEGYEHAYNFHIDIISDAKQILRTTFEENVDQYVDLIEKNQDTDDMSQTERQKLVAEIEELRSKVSVIEERLRYFSSIESSTREKIDKPLVKTKRKEKILMMGGSNIRPHVISELLKENGLKEDCFEYIDYAGAQTFDIKRVKYSTEYSDIFVASVPHNTKGKGKYPSLISYLKNNLDKYPKVTFIGTETSLTSFNTSNLRKAISKSHMYENMNHTSL